ncbi:Ala-interacting subunit 5 [Thecamonas trahens ATCC 50062]|uniref:Ala-interacting subunit 5 n=1 Tax=Thecamonas trahens ATCC 50062 TaxID=461836 RepID=A0A0L0DVN3_THETB|nr:Ala-interacting subunit 5 [Thecamonas trahens ATCC 50062]KNC56290.1 Ala-interacting subunit 5 [Thecamonas trahens ATCC 50062]|eukprot:XP_013760809.1 Ala-interacting subunit 5 [Thecamonas trahens ATCC 50062]
MAEEKSRRPAASLLKQQKLPAWQPVLTPRVVIIGFLAVGLLFVPLGIAFLAAANSVKQVEVDYTQCNPATAPNGIQNCTVSVALPEMKAPVYVYYQLTNYYQNHRRYVKSRNDAQLRGDPPKKWSSLEDCLPRIAVNDDSSENNPSEWFLPCGLIAWSRFNDTFELTPSGSSTPLPWVKDGIAWYSDVKEKFRNPPPTAPGRRLDPPVDFVDQDFIVWMRTAGLPSFRKLYRIIPNDIPAGLYTFSIQSRFHVLPFGGTKGLVVSTASWMGGKNTFLGTAYIVVGILCLLIGVAFLAAQTLFPRKLTGDFYTLSE